MKKTINQQKINQIQQRYINIKLLEEVKSLKLSIKDYQIIRQAVLDFKPGLTVLVGPSNNGKSSIIKAMKAAIYTESGTTPIRNGADSYIVGIQKDNHTVIYQKKEGNTRYVVDGEKYSKFRFKHSRRG